MLQILLKNIFEYKKQRQKLGAETPSIIFKHKNPKNFIFKTLMLP